TFGKETLELLLDKKYLQAMLYMASSVIVTFIAVFCILLLGKGLSMKLRTFSMSIHLFLLILLSHHDPACFYKQYHPLFDSFVFLVLVPHLVHLQDRSFPRFHL